MTTEAIDQQKAEAFAGQMIGILNGGMLALMTSVGHRTGLFDKMATMPPATSEQIASSAGLTERYVREWLGSMVTGGIVEDQLVESFRKGGGVPYSEFGTFQQLMAEMSAQIVDATLLDVTLPLVPGLKERLQ